MRGEKRKLIAIVMAIALVVLGTNFMPNTAKAADSGSITGNETWQGGTAWQVKSNVGGSFSGANTQLGFSYSPTYSGNWPPMHRMQAMESFTTGTTYDFTIKLACSGADGIGQANIWLSDGTLNSPTAGGSDDKGKAIATISSSVSAGGTVEFSGSWTPSMSDPHLFVIIYWPGNVSFTVSQFDVVEHQGPTTAAPTTAAPTTDAQGYWAATADDAWHSVPTYQYKLNSNYTGCKYKGGTSISDPFHLVVGSYVATEGAIQVKTPTVSVTEGHTYKLTMNVANAGSNDMGTNLYAVVVNAGNDQDITSNYTSPVGVTAGHDVDIELNYTAPSSGEVYFKLGTKGYTAVTEYVLTPTNEDTTPTTTRDPSIHDCTLGAWTFADAPGTSGWQYFVHANSTGSTYKGGTALSDPLFINYGTYVEGADYSCMARSPITTVTSGNECEGTISITSSENIGEAGAHIVGASVYAYNSSTGDYTWLANATEGDTNVVADQKTTFHLSYTAPETGKIVYILTTSYTPVATLKFEATHSEETPTTVTTEVPTSTTESGYSAATLGAWTFADAPGTSGWQYFIHANSTGSTYKGGTALNDPLFIKYGTYVEGADYSCMARSPITTVTPGSNCSGTISITSSENIGQSGDQLVGASVYSYNSSTGAYDWLANATEAKTNVVHDTKTTFHLNYTAPDTGKVIYILTTDYTPVATLKFEATHEETTVAPSSSVAPTSTEETSTDDYWTEVENQVDTTVGPWTLSAIFQGDWGYWGKLAYHNNTTPPTAVGDTLVKLVNTSGWLNWGQTMKLENYLSGKTAGNPYKVTITFNTSLPTLSGKRLLVAMDNISYYFTDLVAGDNTLVIDNYTYAGDSNDIAFDLGEMQEGSVINVKSVVVEDNPDPSTSAPETTTAPPVVDPDIALTGYQINTVVEGFRMVGQVEPTINGQSVTEYGFVYGLSITKNPSGDVDHNVTDEKMVVGSNDTYVRSFASTSAGIIDATMGNSKTATYFARTMTFGKKNKAAFASIYRVRVYAKLANDEYVYSDIYDFSVFSIADELYQGCLMNTIDNHNYLYNTILTKVDEDYESVYFDYSHKVAVPGEMNS